MMRLQAARMQAARLKPSLIPSGVSAPRFLVYLTSPREETYRPLRSEDRAKSLPYRPLPPLGKPGTRRGSQQISQGSVDI